MKIELNVSGGEFDNCVLCEENGDNTNLYKVIGTNKFMCLNCFDKYVEAKLLISKVDKEVLENGN